MHERFRSRLPPAGALAGPALAGIATLVLATLGVACQTVDSAAQGGAGFRNDGPVPTALPPESMFAVCWPPDSKGEVSLVFTPTDVMFEAHDGATNSTARCLREIATTAAWPQRPTSLVVHPPLKPAAGFVVLAWVKLLSSTRYGPERGLLDPARLARACLLNGDPRPSTQFEISHDPGFSVKTIPEALTSSERCLEAVLSATAWPSTRPFVLTFDDLAAAPVAAGETGFYEPIHADAQPPADAVAVHDALALKQSAVTACWDEARTRRAGLGGNKTFRFRIERGEVTHAWVVTNGSDVTSPAVDYRFDACLFAVLKGTHARSDGDAVFTWLFASQSR